MDIPSYLELCIYMYTVSGCHDTPDIQSTLITTTVFVPKDVAIKMNCCCKESLMDRMICKKDLVLFLFPQRTYVSDIC